MRRDSTIGKGIGDQLTKDLEAYKELREQRLQSGEANDGCELGHLEIMDKIFA